MEDPLSESIIEVVCKDVRKDLLAGFYFHQEHPVYQAARNGKLDGADVVSVIIYLFFHICFFLIKLNFVSHFKKYMFRLLVFGYLKTQIINTKHVWVFLLL